MIERKMSLLERLTAKMKMFKTVDVGEELIGASPPSVFIGRYGYPKVFVGPLIPPMHGDTAYLDTPEKWIHTVSMPEEIASFRLQLVRGKQAVHVKDTSRITEMIRDIALAERSTEVEAQFTHRPRGGYFHEEVQPFGPSAPLKSMRVDSGRYEHNLEKAYYDIDLKAKDAVVELYQKGVFVSSIQKAFSVGALGINKYRKLVPTRWGITAVDSILSENMLEKIKDFPLIDDFRIYEFESLRNKFIIILLPTTWCYETMEAFFPSIIGDTLEIFGDWEGHEKKKEYSIIGGCYYSARLAVCEKLIEEQKQAGVIILREAYEGYIPLGVFNVRENVREAMKLQPQHFDDLRSALEYVNTKLRISIQQWLPHTTMLRNIVKNGLPKTKTTLPLTLSSFFGSG